MGPAPGDGARRKPLKNYGQMVEGNRRYRHTLPWAITSVILPNDVGATRASGQSAVNAHDGSDGTRWDSVEEGDLRQGIGRRQKCRCSRNSDNAGLMTREKPYP